VKEKNVLLFRFFCNVFIGVKIIKEMPGSVASGTPCIKMYFQEMGWGGELIGLIWLRIGTGGGLL
jgi:hypothetical protein